MKAILEIDMTFFCSLLINRPSIEVCGIEWSNFFTEGNFEEESEKTRGVEDLYENP